MILKNMAKDYSKTKMIMRAIGIPLIIIGIILSIYGWTNFGTSSFEDSSTYAMYFMLGSAMAVIGFILTYLSVFRHVANFYATEASPAIKTASHALGSGLKESGVIGSTEQKEVVKVKCRHCGYLESEDAEFCSKCGQKV